MLRIMTIVGARPQFIKAAVVSRALRRLTGVRESLVHTGQHYDVNMSDVFFAEMEIPEPTHHLRVGSGPHGEQTGRMLQEIERVVTTDRPDVILVYGDTNSTLAGALVGAKLLIPVAHVEAGLRSFNRAMPEEVNRVVTDHLSAQLFAPTDAAVANLSREGIVGARASGPATSCMTSRSRWRRSPSAGAPSCETLVLRTHHSFSRLSIVPRIPTPLNDCVRSSTGSIAWRGLERPSCFPFIRARVQRSIVPPFGCPTRRSARSSQSAIST